MALHVFLFLLVFFLILSLALLCRLSWPHLQLSHPQAGSRRALVHRLLKPRTPLDCPVCRLASPGVKPASAPIRPWSEVKSRRGAPKRVNTEGFACPNQQCPYAGITDAHIHALVGDGKHGHAEQIQTFRCQACRTTFSARRHTPLSRLKTPSHHIAMVLSALAEGLDASAAERVFGYRQATITTWLTRAGGHAHPARELLLPSPPPAPAVGRTPHPAPLRQTDPLALAGHRSPHQDSSCASARPPHATHGAFAHPLAPTDPGCLCASHSFPVTA